MRRGIYRREKLEKRKNQDFNAESAEYAELKRFGFLE
jgi:hypothetical protein